MPLRPSKTTFLHHLSTGNVEKMIAKLEEKTAVTKIPTGIIRITMRAVHSEVNRDGGAEGATNNEGNVSGTSES